MGDVHEVSLNEMLNIALFPTLAGIGHHGVTFSVRQSSITTSTFSPASFLEDTTVHS